MPRARRGWEAEGAPSRGPRGLEPRQWFQLIRALALLHVCRMSPNSGLCAGTAPLLVRLVCLVLLVNFNN